MRLRSWLSEHRWPLAWIVASLALSLLPLLLARCCAPAGRSGLGTVWFINDFAQYESAMRQGASSAGWLIRDPFTAEPHAPAFMFPLYVALGKIAAATGLPAGVLERATEMGARTLFLIALWRFARTFTTGEAAARAAFLFALFSTGFGLLLALAAQVAGLGALPPGTWSYETTSFGLLFSAPHVPLAMAATLELARWLGPRGKTPPVLVPARATDAATAETRPQRLEPSREATAGALAWAAALGAALALLHPFHAPVLLLAMAVVGGYRWRAGQGAATLLAAGTAAAGALPLLVPTVATFNFDPFWGATYGRQNVLPSPGPYALLADLGVPLLLALAGAWSLRLRLAPPGLLVWGALAIAAMELPVSYQRRLAFGIQPTVAILAANAFVALLHTHPASGGTRTTERQPGSSHQGLLAGARAHLQSHAAALARLAVISATAAGTALVIASIVASLLANAPLPVYRSTADLDAAAAWLGTHVQPGDVILAGWEVANYLAPRTDGVVFGGHPVATLKPADKRDVAEAVLARRRSSLAARGLGVQWLVYGPADSSRRPDDTPAFTAGAVRVYRVERHR